MKTTKTEAIRLTTETAIKNAELLNTLVASLATLDENPEKATASIATLDTIADAIDKANPEQLTDNLRDAITEAWNNRTNTWGKETMLATLEEATHLAEHDGWISPHLSQEEISKLNPAHTARIAEAIGWVDPNNATEDQVTELLSNLEDSDILDEAQRRHILDWEKEAEEAGWVQDWQEEAEEEGWVDLSDMTTDQVREAIDNNLDGHDFESIANDNGYYKVDELDDDQVREVLTNADEDDLIEEMRDRGLLNNWRTSAEEAGWISPEKLARMMETFQAILTTKAEELIEAEFAMAQDSIDEYAESAEDGDTNLADEATEVENEGNC